jgi:hypothetical protein
MIVQKIAIHQWHAPECARWRRNSIWVEEKKKTYEKTVNGWKKLARGERKI